MTCSIALRICSLNTGCQIISARISMKGNDRPASNRAGGQRSLWRNRRGAVAIYVASSALVLLGIGAFSIDLGHIMTVNTELQNAADAASIAGAQELDRFSGARTRPRPLTAFFATRAL